MVHAARVESILACMAARAHSPTPHWLRPARLPQSTLALSGRQLLVEQGPKPRVQWLPQYPLQPTKTACKSSSHMVGAPPILMLFSG